MAASFRENITRLCSSKNEPVSNANYVNVRISNTDIDFPAHNAVESQN